MNDAQRFSYSSYKSEIIVDTSSKEFFKPFAIQEFVEFRKNYFQKNQSFLSGISQDKWYVIQNFYCPATYLMRPKNRRRIELVHKQWPKMYEILVKFALKPDRKQKFKSVHLEEEYGAVVGAVNHYLSANFQKLEWEWIATQVNPYYEEDPTRSLVEYFPVDDSLIHFHYDKFVFGRDYTGNLCDVDNIKHLESKCSDGVSLITADASFSIFKVEQRPQQDEKLFYDLLYAELTASLRILCDGGNFIWKVFTMFNENNICLMYLLTLVFEKVDLYKPFASPKSSFEVYVVCQKYKKFTRNLDKLLDKMLDNIGKQDPIFHQSYIPAKFLKEHLSMMSSLEKSQNHYIELYLKLGQNSTSRDSEKLIQQVEESVSTFLSDYKIKALRLKNRLTPTTSLSNAFSKIKSHGFLLPDRVPLIKIVEFDKMNVKDRKAVLQKTLGALMRYIQFPKKEALPKIISLEIEVIFGKPIQNPTKSMFVAPDFLFKMVLVIEKAYGKSLYKLSMFRVNCLLGYKRIPFAFENNFGYSEKQFLRKVLSEFIEMKPYNITFERFYFVTHFSTSVLALLVRFYKTSSMDSFGNIHLKKFENDESDWKHILKLRDYLANEDYFSIVSFMRPTSIQRTDFAIKIVDFNNFLLLTHIKRFVDSMA